MGGTLIRDRRRLACDNYSASANSMIKKARDVIDLYREKIARAKQSEADAVLIMQLLAGREVRAGKVNIRYLPRNGPEERRARSALAREVRRHMKGFSGELLALAIDPRTPTAIPGMRPTRKILFIGAAQGKESKWARDLRVVHFIRGELRKTTGK